MSDQLSEPISNHPTRSLEALVALGRLLEEAVDASGWHSPGLLVRIDRIGRRPSDEITLGLLPLDEGEHPLSRLDGFTAPAAWEGLGVVAHGRAHGRARSLPDGLAGAHGAARVDGIDGVDGGAATVRSDQGRIRALFLATRSGLEVSGFRRPGHDLVLQPSTAVGAIPDAVRRCLGLPVSPAISQAVGSADNQAVAS